MRARESALWELEERQIHEKQQLAKRQLKDGFFLQRHQVKLLPLNSFGGISKSQDVVGSKK